MFILRSSAKNWNKFASYSVTSKNTAQSWQIDSTPGWFCENAIEQEIIVDYSKEFKCSKYNIIQSINNKTIVYNTASEAVVSFSNSEFESIHVAIKNKTVDESILKSLFKLGIIVYAEEDEKFKIQYIRDSSIYNTSKIKSFVLYPTTECNARCFYCFAHDDIMHGERMTIKTAGNVLNFIFKQVCEGDEVIFRWFGGEPLIAADVIDYIISNFKKHFGDKVAFHSIITTNASLMTEGLLNHAILNWNLRKLLIPIDGYKDNHHRRKNYKISATEDYYQSLKKLIALSLDKGVYIICRLNLDKKNIDDFDDVVQDYKQFSAYPHFYMQATTLHVPEFMADKENQNFFKVEDFDNLYYSIFSKLLENGFYKSILDIIPKRQLSVCEARLNNHYLISSDGRLYACEQENHIPQNSIGDCQFGIIHNENLKKWINNQIPAECAECPYIPICLGGCEYYRMRQDTHVSPCTRVKFYINALMKLIYNYLPKYED